jgi:hypothetical protein
MYFLVNQLKKSITNNENNINYSNPISKTILNNNTIKVNKHNNFDDTPEHSENEEICIKGLNNQHRYVESICKFKMPCVACQQSIQFGSKALKCTECYALSHIKCAQISGNNCGLAMHLTHNTLDTSPTDYYNDYIMEKLKTRDDSNLNIEPSAPSPQPDAGFSHNSSNTTDNNESDTPLNANTIVKRINEINYDNYADQNEQFSFTDSMLDALDAPNNAFDGD